MWNTVSGYYKVLLNYFGVSKKKNTDVSEKKKEDKNIILPMMDGDTKREFLTDLKMQDFFGTNYEGLVYYNFDTGKWNCERFLGFCVPYQDRTAQVASELKKILDAELERKNWEVVAVVTTLIRDKYFMGVGERVNRPRFNAKGKSVVGTIVRRDKNTGKILPVPADWIGVFHDDTLCGAIWYGGRDFLNSALQLLKFRYELLRIHSR